MVVFSNMGSLLENFVFEIHLQQFTKTHVISFDGATRHPQSHTMHPLIMYVSTYGGVKGEHLEILL